MPSLPVAVALHDGIYHLGINDDLRIPFMQHGAPLRTLGEGWSVHALHTLFAPVLLMELVHDTGPHATWYFDSTARFVGHRAANLPPLLQAAMARGVAPVIQAVLSGSGALPPGTLAEFSALHEETRRDVCTVLGDLAPPRLLTVQQAGEGIPAANRPGPAIAPGTLRHALSIDFQARLRTAAQTGGLTWPSPVDGAECPCSGSLCLNEFLLAYRFQDAAPNPAASTVFFVLATGHNAACIGLYIPSHDVFAVRDEGFLPVVAAFIPNATAALADYACRHADTLPAYLARPGPKPVACVMRESHIGHQVWNELSGLDRLVQAHPPSMPYLLPFAGTRHAFFGPLDQLFPEFAGRTRPDLATMDGIIRFSHQANLVLARFTHEHVSAGLRSRIMDRVRGTPDFDAVRQRRAQNPGPVILVGLRVENRTAIGLAAFLVGLVRCIAATLPGALVVLDGQNSDSNDGQQASPSFAVDTALQPPVAYEAAICNEVQAAAAQLGIPVEVASGRSIATSLAWADLAAAFVGFWGAGFAKYRWIANRPGIALTCRYYLEGNADLHIYDLPVFMEDPTPLVFADPASIHDQPGAPMLVPLEHPRYANFRVDEPAFFAQVRAVLARFAPVPAITPGITPSITQGTTQGTIAGHPALAAQHAP